MSGRPKSGPGFVKIHMIFAYDPESKMYRYWWFDNYGQVRQFEGRYSSAKNAIVFLYDHTDPDTNVALQDRYTYKFNTDDEIEFTMEFGTGPRQYEKMLTVTYTRKGKKEQQPSKKRARPAVGF